jgi:hypothetical protein
VSWSLRAVAAAHAHWDWRAAVRSTRVVAAPEVVAVVIACSCCDTASAATTHSWEAVAAAWTLAMVVTKSVGAMVMVSRLERRW